MDMIRTFRIIALNKETHRIRDFKYTESYSISGTNGIVNFYDDEFTALSTETIDLNEWSVRAMPNKTSRLGARFKKRPLPSISSIMPRITFEYRPIQRVNITVPVPSIQTPTISYSIKYPAWVNISVPVPSIIVPNVTVAKQ